ncbi:RNA polymerase sigma factor [Aliikangiella coralliicola]|nr:sigma-70 family RNA polymerase sigma factor [Aliikangiella coralliicola]
MESKACASKQGISLISDCKSKIEASSVLDIVSQAISGNRHAIRRLIRLLTPVIQSSVAHILTRTRSDSSSCDIHAEVADYCQDIFMLLFKNDSKILRSWDPDKGMSLNSFISLITKRRVISALRQEKLTHRLDDKTIEQKIECHRNVPDIETQFIERQLLLNIISSLKKDISELGYDLFIQLFLFERTPEEISAKTGVSKNSIYVWKNRLRKKAKDILQKLELEEAQNKTSAKKQTSHQEAYVDE